MENIKRIRELVAELSDLLGPADEAPRMVGTCAVGRALANAVNNDEVGFKDGWISSIHFDKLLEALDAPVMPINMRRGWLKSNGYDWHPALTNGRVNNPVACDSGKKPRLYVKAGHWSLRLTEPTVVAGAYEEAQQ